MGSGAAAEAAVIEGEDVDAGGVEGREGGDTAGERAAGVVEIENRDGDVFRLRVGGNPPAVELGKAGVGDVEVDFFVRQAGAGRSRGDGARGMEEELPLALVEEQAEGGVSAEGGSGEGEGEGSEEPAGADIRRGFGAVVDFSGWRLALRHCVIRRQARRGIRGQFRRRGR